MALGISRSCAAAEEKGHSSQPSSQPIAPAPGGPTFVTLPILAIPVIEGGDVTRQVSVGIALELAKGHTLESIKPKEDMLIDAMFRDLYGQFAARSHADRIAVPDTMKERLGRVADRVLGPGVVRQVLILQLLERPVGP